MGKEAAARPWTDEEFVRAMELKRRKWTNSQIGAELGRSGPAVAIKVSMYEQKKIREAASWILDIGSIKVSEEQRAEREARREASYRRSPTAVIFGDPPPGYSALDRRGM